MPTSWHYKSFGQEFGPVYFCDLTRMVRDGELASNDLVRPGYDHRWHRVDEVPGLIHMSQVVAAEGDMESDADAEDEYDKLEFASEVDLENLLSADEQPEWMRRMLPRPQSGETEKEHVRGILRNERVETGSADKFEVATAETAPIDSSVTGDEPLASSPNTAEKLGNDVEPPSAVGALLAEIEESLEAEAAAQSRKRHWRMSLSKLGGERISWTQVLRVMGAMLCAPLTILWLESWSSREALRFPGLIDPGMRPCPLIGTCSSTEFWILAVDLMLVGAGIGYAAVRWVERHVD